MATNLVSQIAEALAPSIISRIASGLGLGESSSPDAPESMPDLSPGTIVGGLGGLLKQFQQKGLGEVADSWIKTGPNDAVAPGQISDALGPDVIDTLAPHRPLQGSGRADSVPSPSQRSQPAYAWGPVPLQQELARLIG